MSAGREGGRWVWSLTRDAAREWWEDDAFRLAASLAFYTVFSMAPILLIAASVAGRVFGHDAARQQIVAQVEQLVGPSGGSAVAEMLGASEGIGESTLAIVFGVVTLVIGSTVVFVELQSALNRIWDVEAAPKRSKLAALIRDRLLSFGLVIAVAFLLLISLAVSALLSGIQAYMSFLAPDLFWIWYLLDVSASFCVVVLLFALVYRYLPDVEIGWRDVAFGSVTTALLFTLGKFAIGAYLGRAGFASMYGAAGSLVLLLVWIYYSALISFFGAELTQVYTRRYGSRVRPQEHAVRSFRKGEPGAG